MHVRWIAISAMLVVLGFTPGFALAHGIGTWTGIRNSINPDRAFRMQKNDMQQECQTDGQAMTPAIEQLTARMPRLPGFEVGLVLVAQIQLPPLIVRVVARWQGGLRLPEDGSTAHPHAERSTVVFDGEQVRYGTRLCQSNLESGGDSDRRRADRGGGGMPVRRGPAESVCSGCAWPVSNGDLAHGGLSACSVSRRAVCHQSGVGPHRVRFSSVHPSTLEVRRSCGEWTTCGGRL